MGNSVIYKTPRSKQYRARQGYTDTLRHVVLTRVDSNNKKYEPTEEAYQLPEMGWLLEGDRHGISTLGTLTIRFLRTEDIVNYLAGLEVPHNLRIDVYCYHIFHEGDKYWLWSGVLMELPGGESQYPTDKLQLTFVGAPAAWPEGDDVKDPATGNWYRNRHVTDDILPALLEEAFATVAGQADLEAPHVYNEAPFWSSIDRPRKKLAVPNASFDDTCRATGLAWHPGNELLYIGVHDAVASGTQPWLISYDPETRKWKRVTPLAYRGAKAELKPPTEWEIQHLEHSEGAVFGVARTNHPNLLDPQAHYHSLVYFYPGFTKFRRSAPITITAGSALTTIDTIALDVSALTFDTADHTDRAVAYWNGSTWEEIDSDYRDIGDGERIYFKLQNSIGAAASDNTHYRLFWRGTGRVSKTNRDNIYMLWSGCNNIADWINVGPGVWTSVGGRLVAPTALNTLALLDDDPGTPDITLYGLVNRLVGNGNAGLEIRGEPGGTGWMCHLTWVNTIALTAIPAGGGGAAAFPNLPNTDYIIKVKVVGNTWEVWASLAGTPIAGAPLINIVNATYNANTHAGFSARHWVVGPTSEHDDLYGIHAVAAEPTVGLGATESINGIYDRNLFTLHDRGMKIRTRYVQYDNRDPDGDPPQVSGVDYYGDMGMYVAGWPTPRHEVKECGTFSPSSRITAPHISWGDYGSYVVRIGIDSNKRNHPVVGMGIEIWDITYDYRQYLGKILSIKERANYFELTTEQPIKYHYVGPGATRRTILYAVSVSDGDNIFVAEPQELSIEGLYPAGSLPDPTEIYAEQRRVADAGENHYWPRDIAAVDEGEKILVDEVGYAAFSTVRELQEYDTDPAFMKYLAGVPIQFDVRMKGYNPAYCVADGFYVSSPIQKKAYERPGKVGLYRNGALVRTSEGQYLVTYGDIFLYKDGNTVYVAWNELRSDGYGAWYNACCQGRWNGSVVTVDFRDRSGANWRNSPERYITAYAHHKGHSYFGLRRYDRRWVNLQERIFWAAPPQASLSPREYDGGYACLGAVKGDKVDVLGVNPVVRLGPLNEPGRKEWRLADVQTGTREIGLGAWLSGALASGELPGIYTITWFTLLALEPFNPGATAYNDAVGREVRGQYITLGAGRDERAEIAVL